MHSETIEILRNNFKHYYNPMIAFFTLVIAISFGFFLKYSLTRKRYFDSYPSKKIGFFNILGHITEFTSHAKVKGINLNHYMLQQAMGYREIFKHEAFIFGALPYVSLIGVVKGETLEDLISGSKNMEKHWTYKFLHPWLGTGLLTSHGSKWKSRRKLLTPAFHFEILKDFMPILNEQSQILVKQLRKETENTWVDITRYMTLCSLDIICETTLGVSIGAQKDNESEYIRAISRVSESTMARYQNPMHYMDWMFYLSKSGSQFKKDIELLHQFTRSVIARKKQKMLLNSSNRTEENASSKKGRALMDLLLDEHIRNETLTEEDIREEVDTFTFEGHDTTSMGLTWTLYLIGLYKDVQEQITEEIDRIFGEDCERPVTTDDIKDMEYLDRVLKESLRLYPPVPAFGRMMEEDTEFCGSTIPKGFGLLVAPYAIHRDETAYSNPEKFDPDRFLPENVAKRSPFSFIPFSAGPRNCIGQRFAMMELKVVIVNVLRNYTVKSLDPRDKVLVVPDLILRADGPIRIKLRNRKPLPS